MRLHVLLLLAACEPPVPQKTLPQLVVAAAPSTSVAVASLKLIPNELMIWEVHVEGLSIGRAELRVGDREVSSQFATNELASMFGAVRYDLVTELIRPSAYAEASRESLEIDGETDTATIAFSDHGYTVNGRAYPVPAGRAHSLHTALGWLRAWADPHAPSAALYVVHLGKLYRLEVGAPIRERLQDMPALRIDGHLHGGKQPIAIAVWLEDTNDRAPRRIVATSGSFRITAELVERTAVAAGSHVLHAGTLASR
jgi:hypothetical protein